MKRFFVALMVAVAIMAAAGSGGYFSISTAYADGGAD